MKRQDTAKYWLGFILAAVLFHLLLLLTVKTSVFSIFLKPISEPSETRTSSPFAPDAIITIPVTLEDEVREQAAEVPAASDRATDQHPVDIRPPSGGAPDQPPNVDELIGDGDMPLQSPGSDRAVLIPPRPVEIAWPDTRNLKQCVGESIELQILVAVDGTIKEITVVDSTHPRECIEAARTAAAKIVFIPGRADGVPTEMWTHIRIDFRERR